MRLQEFNEASEVEAMAVVRPCADVPAWVEGVVAGRPYADAPALLAEAERLSLAWTAEDLDAALAHHPRIGQRPEGAGAEAEHSRREQASISGDRDPGVEAGIAAGNADYEDRFGRVFLVRAAGRSRTEILDQLHARLGNDDVAEVVEALQQLREIALLRLAAGVEAA